MRYCRKLVLDSRLTWDLARFYENHQAVEEVFVTTRCLGLDKWVSECPRLYQVLLKLAPAGKDAAPLHVTYQCSDTSLLYEDNASRNHDLVTYEFFDLSIYNTQSPLLDEAIVPRAVVRLSDHPTAGPDEIARIIAYQLLYCFFIYGETLDPNPGQLYLCDIPQLVLYPEELSTAVNVEKIALLKLYNSLNKTRPYPVTNWKIFHTKIKLVKSGFRSSISDLVEERRSVQRNPRSYRLKLTAQDGPRISIRRTVIRLGRVDGR
jgi:hypothetical protein